MFAGVYGINSLDQVKSIIWSFTSSTRAAKVEHHKHSAGMDADLLALQRATNTLLDLLLRLYGPDHAASMLRLMARSIREAARYARTMN